MGAGTKPGMALDGHNMWACLSTAAGPAKEAACAAAGREDILYSEYSPITTTITTTAATALVFLHHSSERKRDRDRERETNGE